MSMTSSVIMTLINNPGSYQLLMSHCMPEALLRRSLEFTHFISTAILQSQCDYYHNQETGLKN